MSDHPISLKVMRVSRPALSAAWEPFYSTSPAFSAHSSASITSLQGEIPLSGHPKTLRDLSQPNEMLSLPVAFGSIYLGETFESCLCINNDSNIEIQGVSLKVEIQTATTKVTLVEIGGPSCTLGVGGTLEDVVKSEMTELGQHVLACTVSCTLPGHQQEPILFRKFYKFVVTNPLSVKTKIHAARSPTALLSVDERDKLFMQVHVQNLTHTPLWFERISFECVDGWMVEEVANFASDIFLGVGALLPPQDIRQYVYILTPTVASSLPRDYSPGSVVALGKMDIAWRSSFGEPGRLVTSTLTRRIPLLNPPPQPVPIPAPALPPHMKRTNSLTTAPRPQSPAPRSATPPIVRPGSPSRASTLPQQHPPTQGSLKPADLGFYLSLHRVDRDKIVVNQPFSLDYTLTVTASATGGRRTISLLVQQYQFTSAVSASIQGQDAVQTQSGVVTPRLLSGYSTPSSALVSGSHQKIASVSRRRESEFQEVSLREPVSSDGTIPPPRVPGAQDETTTEGSVLLLGPSAFTLPTITLDSEESGSGKCLVDRNFSLHFLPTREGFITIGGLRVLLLDEGTNGSVTLNDWKVIAELHVLGVA